MNKGAYTACNPRLRQVLRRGAGSLDADAVRSVRDFVRSQFNDDGGIRGRSRESDLYYTVFGLECAQALDLESPVGLRGFLERQCGADLDFVHCTCLARCLELAWPEIHAERPKWTAHLRQRIFVHLCAEGGFHSEVGSRHGSVYDSFLGMLACESVGEPFPEPERLLACLGPLQKSGGGFRNDSRWEAATTPVTAAALGLYWELQQTPPAGSREWLLARGCARGGFAAAALVPLPDLLSTATALHALRPHGLVDQGHADACLDFVTSVWDESGGFCGHALDRKADCEYTFYALLSLGNLQTESVP